MAPKPSQVTTAVEAVEVEAAVPAVEAVEVEAAVPAVEAVEVEAAVPAVEAVEVEAVEVETTLQRIVRLAVSGDTVGIVSTMRVLPVEARPALHAEAVAALTPLVATIGADVYAAAMTAVLTPLVGRDPAALVYEWQARLVALVEMVEAVEAGSTVEAAATAATAAQSAVDWAAVEVAAWITPAVETVGGGKRGKRGKVEADGTPAPIVSVDRSDYAALLPADGLPIIVPGSGARGTLIRHADGFEGWAVRDKADGRIYLRPSSWCKGSGTVERNLWVCKVEPITPAAAAHADGESRTIDRWMRAARAAAVSA